MVDVLLDALIDTLKLVPFLFVAFLIIEVFEHKFTEKSKKTIEKSGRFGVVIGSLLGLVPQCGFSTIATNLYTTRIITLGTLISIYLSTSDEMLPILISKNADISLIISILLIKLVVAFISGFIIDLILRKKPKEKIDYHICDEEHCHCKDHNPVVSALKHTLNVAVFILIFSIILNTIIYFLGSDFLYNSFMNNHLLGPIITSLIGLIPNCAASITITELYLTNIIPFGSLISGLLSASGLAYLVLFKSNKNLKENLKIISIILFISIITGLLINVI